MTAKTITEEFETRQLKIRGVTYKFREISAKDYDDILKLVTGPDGEAEMNAVLRLIAAKSIEEPALSVEEITAKPYPVYSALMRCINEMHFARVEDQKNGEKAPNA